MPHMIYTESVEDEDDVVSVIADSISKLTAYVGPPEHLHVLLAPLHLLLCGEDNEVRDKALAAAEALTGQMSRAQVLAHVVPLLHDLSVKDWYTARSAAALLCPAVYCAVDEESRRGVLSMLTQCAADITPSVRRAAARSLPKVAATASAAQLPDIAHIFATLAKDDQDSIRIQAIQASVALTAFFPLDLQTKYLAAAATAWATDRSWRVRWSLGHHLHDLAAHIYNANRSAHPEAVQTVISNLCSVYDQLLNDAEPEVRASSVSHCSALCVCLPRPAVRQLLDSVQRLGSDSSDFVRAAAASELSLLCTQLGREDTVALLLPTLLQLLRDERSEVRLNIIAQLHAINDAIGVDALAQSLLPALSDLGMDSKWRVRLAVIEHMPMIARQLGQAFFSAQLINLCLHWLSDRVHFVRRAAAQSICQLTVLFGADWALTYILPALTTMRTTSAFSQRLTILSVAQALLAESSLPQDSPLGSALVALVVDLAADPVANVRLTAAKIFGDLANKERGDVRAVLAKLTKDTDRDVRYYANKAVSC